MIIIKIGYDGRNDLTSIEDEVGNKLILGTHLIGDLTINEIEESFNKVVNNIGSVLEVFPEKEGLNDEPEEEYPTGFKREIK